MSTSSSSPVRPSSPHLASPQYYYQPSDEEYHFFGEHLKQKRTNRLASLDATTPTNVVHDDARNFLRTWLPDSAEVVEMRDDLLAAAEIRNMTREQLAGGLPRGSRVTNEQFDCSGKVAPYSVRVMQAAMRIKAVLASAFDHQKDGSGEYMHDRLFRFLSRATSGNGFDDKVGGTSSELPAAGHHSGQ